MNIEKNNVFACDNLRGDHYMQETPCGTLIITFTERSHRDLEGYGFGTQFLLKNGFDVLAIKSSTDVWYENLTGEQISSILKYLQLCNRQYKYVVGYGSSMGAYAAIKFSKELGMTHVIAISPLYDIKSDFDKRWAKDASVMSVAPMMEVSAISRIAKYCIICDDKSPDYAHLQKFREIIPQENLSAVKLPYSGHPSSYMLNDLGMLQDVVLEFLKNFYIRINPRSYKGKKLRSPPYIFNLVNALIQHKKYKTAINLNKRLLELRGNNADYHFQTCRIFEKLNSLDEAIAAVSRAATISPGNISFSLYRENIVKKQLQSFLVK